ncbi:MAG: hypothetical protein MUF19_01545 [Candidatus Pacebacteria bacterium]|jgi:hypothetical protein|nr:hypothetical protein [Candidatus Paceibacterota bacterium]
MALHHGDVVYVAKLTASGTRERQVVTCVPVRKVVQSVGKLHVIFTDGTDQYINKTFPDSEEGKAACQVWCDHIAQHQAAFHWPVRLPS